MYAHILWYLSLGLIESFHSLSSTCIHNYIYITSQQVLICSKVFKRNVEIEDGVVVDPIIYFQSLPLNGRRMKYNYNLFETSLKGVWNMIVWMFWGFQFNKTQFPTIWECGDELLDRHPMSQTSCIASMVNFDAWDWVVGVMFKSSVSICYQ
jgi:hypothetical protein